MRKLSSVERSLVQLSADIYFVYKDLTENNESFSLSRYQLALIQQKILNNLYILNPLRVKFVNKDDLIPFLWNTLPVFSDIMIGIYKGDIFQVIMPDNEEDLLVLMALSLMLFRLTYGGLPKDGYRMEDRADSFYSSLQEMGKVDRLYRLDLGSSLSQIPISLILDKVLPFVGEGPVYKLISSFLNLPIIDDNGNNRIDISFGTLPPAGEITRILFNIALMDIFDREFAKRYPGIAFTRFINEVFLPSRRGDDSLLINEKAIYELLKELNLSGKILSTGLDDEPLMSYKKLAFLDSDGQVQVCNPYDYFD